MIHPDGSYAIHEMYPLDEGDAWTENPVTVTGESVEDVKKSLVMMLNDIDRHGVKEYNHHADQMSK
jgi:ethanolamine utilization microcompartment shell protein EutL